MYSLALALSGGPAFLTSLDMDKAQDPTASSDGPQ